jgi:hypothetical protein
MRTSETDYLVVGAGAMGMAFTDALVDHADVHVTLVDRRHAASGHWQAHIHSSSSIRRRCSTASRRHARQRRRAAKRPGRGSRNRLVSRRSGLLRRHPASPLHRLGPRHLPRGASITPTAPPVSADVRVSGETVKSTCDTASSTPPTCRRRSPRRHPRRSVLPTTSGRRDQRARQAGRGANSYVIVGSGKTATDGSCGCWRTACSQTESSGYARVTPGCSIAPSSNPIQR